jgi:hypothetical protein
MERVKITDEWLYKYMPVVDAAIIQDLEKGVDTSYHFSKNFERKMKRLIRREAHPWMEMSQKLMKKIAVFFIVVISATFIFTMSVKAYRKKFFETIKTFFEDSVLYNYFVIENDSKFTNYVPSYIPSGYFEIDKISSETNLSIMYENKNGELITWDQILATETSNVVMDTDYDSLEKIEMDGYTIDVALYESGYACVYSEYEQYVFVLTADSLNIEEIKSIFESMEEQED